MKKLPWLYITALFFLFYLLLYMNGEADLVFFLKPFLIPLLAIKLYYTRFFSVKKWLLLGLTFSWIGDVVLMFQDLGSFYFIAGLFSFLTAHVCYIYMFVFLKSFKKLSTKSWMLFSFVLLYLIVFLYLLITNGELKEMHLPVFLYSCVIGQMLWGAGCLYLNKPFAGYDLILLGAISFVLSDSILAINKFWTSSEIPDLSIYIMLSYLLAQYLIVSGIIWIHRFK